MRHSMKPLVLLHNVCKNGGRPRVRLATGSKTNGVGLKKEVGVTIDQEALLLATARTLRMLVEVRLKAPTNLRVMLTEVQWAAELDNLNRALEPFTSERVETSSDKIADPKRVFQPYTISAFDCIDPIF